ncbi:MAG TPA: cytochrome c biogenesis protein DipZ [Solirubrobacteraceae bacterium]|nr:cytochrome c biogenesis protein DipZ [Solirubrobacteraceae bacterium]
MALLILFGFIAGIGTALSPCVLPVLPIALSAGATGGRRRPAGIVVGLALSFTFATVALVYLLDALGLSDGLLRTVAIVALLVFGVTLLMPPLAARAEVALSRAVPGLGGPRTGGDGFGSGLLIGASLGLVYAPCAGPVLAGVITVSASQPFTAGRLAVALAYGVGSALALYVLMLGGRRLIAPLSRRGNAFGMAMGAVMVIVALAMLGDYDLRFQSAIAKDLPSVLVNPTEPLENSSAAQRALSDLRGGTRGVGAPSSSTADGGATPVLTDIGVAPEFAGNQRWFNTPGNKPLTLKGLRGRVVLVDFWTYSCINCLRTLPYLKAWDRRYRAAGLTVVGVHAPEFPFEKDAGNVAEAIDREGIRYPVVQDNELATWNAYGNQGWPSEFFIDASGHVRFHHYGEGAYAEKERVIRALLAEAGRSAGSAPPVATGITRAAPVTTAESYLGALRADRFANGRIATGTKDYGAAPAPPLDHLAYGGAWSIGDEAATASGGAVLRLNFTAGRVYLVLGSPGLRRQVSVTLDGRPIAASDAGDDVHDGRLTVGGQRLYRLVELPHVGTHQLLLRFEPGVKGYAFTFG